MPRLETLAKQKRKPKVVSLHGNSAISHPLAPGSAGGILRASIVQPNSSPGRARG